MCFFQIEGKASSDLPLIDSTNTLCNMKLEGILHPRYISKVDIYHVY
jgi:hypothetical protein